MPFTSKWTRTLASPRFFWCALAALALAGVALVLLDTRWGAYLSDDSYYYIAPARDLLAGRGFHPSYIFGPLFPLALAGLGLLGIEPLEGARWLNAVLFGVNLSLVGLIARRMRLSQGFSLLAVSLVLLSDVVVEAHGWAMSEALAFSCTLGSLAALLAYLDTRRWGWWAAAATLAALSLLARYAALPLVAAAVLILLVFGPARGWGKRLLNAAVFGLANTAPLGIYWLRNQLTSGHAVRYQHFYWLSLSHDQLVWFTYNGLSLFVPGRLLRGHELLAGGLALAALLLLAGGLALRYGRRLRQTGDPLQRAGMALLLALVGFHLLMLFLARGLTELDVFNPRYLVPILIAVLAVVAALSQRVWQVGGRVLRVGLLVCLAGFLLYYGYRTLDFSRQVTRAGLGYSNVGWHNSETVAYLKAHPELGPLVSTGEMGIYFWTGRMPEGLVAYADPTTLRAYLCQTGGALFLMDQMPAEIYGTTREAIAGVLQLAHRFNDSEMYVCPRAGP